MRRWLFSILAPLLVGGVLYAQTIPPGVSPVPGAGGVGAAGGAFTSSAGETSMNEVTDFLLFGTAGPIQANTQWETDWATLLVSVGGSGQGADFNFKLTEAASGSHPLMVGLNLDMDLTNGGATTILKETLRVSAPSGATSSRTYAIHTLGDIRIDGALIGSGTSPQGIRVNTNGLVSLNDITGNADSTRGLFVQQATFDDHIFSLKSTDVAHGITDEAETDTYGFWQKIVAASGGLVSAGLTEATIAYQIEGKATTEDTTKGTGSDAYVVLTGQRRSGTGVIDPGPDANVVAIKGNATTLWLVDFDGDTFQTGARHGAFPSVALGAAATTFSVSSNAQTVTGDGGGNTIATITGGKSGQLLTLLFNDANVTITDNDAHAGNSVDLAGAATDFVSADDTTLLLINSGGVWYEVSRSVN